MTRTYETLSLADAQVIAERIRTGESSWRKEAKKMGYSDNGIHKRCRSLLKSDVKREQPYQFFK